jgi:tetratricopeptide (TPR) repeat protein
MNHRLIAIIFSITLVVSAFVPQAFSQQSAGSIFSVQGEVSIKRGAKRFPAEEGLSLRPGDIVMTGEPGRVAVELPDGSYVRIASGSRMQLPGEKKALGLFEGALHFLSHSEKHPVIETQTVTAAIRGTEFVLTSSGEDTTISMLSGIVDATSKHGSAHLKGGEGVSFHSGKGPDVFSIVGGDNTVQWSMFVPFVAGDIKSKRGRDAVDKFMSGGRGSSRALGALKSISSRKPCSEEGVLYARLLLSSGAPDKGRAILLSCLTKKMPSGLEVQARASLAQFFLANGDVTKADDFSSSALDIAPTDTLARLVRSFVLQQRGDLTGALSLVEGSSEEELQAREAEVLFMFGRISEAEDILARITGSSWYTETLKGFLALANRDTTAAETLFESAAELESGAGLPQLGLGLVAAGRGELLEARSFFEKATVLEPSRALYRSYLGKAYFEADTYSGAKPELARAIELDPNDPTPHLYRSFLRVAENDLVGALDDITEARKLAGARSVYRSKFLLDQDSAMQSASIGRVYQQLGFKERGRIEALTAISSDYQNATAHRLLSQTQEDIFVADTIASEQRIANLFSPLSINVVDSIGTNVSLNEYSQLFEADGVRTATNTFYDSKDDFVKTGILTAIKDGNTVVGLSADGAVRDGASEKPRTTAGTFGFSVQSQPSWADRLLLEGKGIFTGSSDPDETTDSLNGNISAAYLHRFSPEVTGVIQSSFDRERVQYYNRGYEDLFFSTVVLDGIEDTALISGLFDERTRRYESTILNEGQLIAKTGVVNSVLTLRNITNNVDGYSRSEIFEDDFGELDGLGATLRSNGPVNLSGNSVSYLGTLAATESLQFQLGGEFESIEWASQDIRPLSSDSSSRSLWSPKAGLIYNLDNEVAFRAGYGESLGKTTRTDLISIEPTHIGGINQRFNDLPGTRSRNFGLGLDLNPRKDWFAGAEWTRRWLRENRSEALYEYTVDLDEGRGFGGVDLGENYNTPIGQDFLSTYIYHVFDKQTVGGIDYRFVRQETNGVDGNSTRDHRLSTFGRYFLSGGMFLQGSAAYRYQSRVNNQIFGTGSDGAWLMGAGVGYRLPTRQGLVLLDVQNIFGENIDLDQETYFNEPVFNDPTVRLSVNINF